jgi:Tol biopolymer transport system component
MNDLSVEDRISSWLEQEAPGQLPDRVLRSTFELTRGSRQVRGFPWNRRIAVAAPQRWLLVGLALLALLAGLALAAGWLADRHEPITSGANGRIAYDADFHILSVGEDGTDRRQLTAGTNDFWPVWSPNGSKVAFYRAPDVDAWMRGVSVWIMNADGSGAVNLTGETAIDIADGWGIAWAPSSDRVAFVSGTDDGPTTVYTAMADGSVVRQIAGRSAFAATPAWSPDGTEIAWRAGVYDADRGIYVVKPDGSGSIRLTREVHQFNRFTTPVWSPDGKQLLFYSGPAGSQDVWVVNRDGSGERRLTSTGFPFDEIWPVWSPDGSRIAFVRLDHHETSGTVMVMDAAGSNLHAVSEPTADGPVGWSPDGTRVLARLCPTRDPDCGGDDTWNLVALDPQGLLEPQVVGSVPGLGLLSWQRLPP